MTIGKWLQSNIEILKNHDIPSSRLDCLILLEDETNKTRIEILSNLDQVLTEKNIFNLNSKIKLRKDHVPISYIRGKTEFYGREFIINENVLEPRPESETMIDMIKTKTDVHTIIDIGTGSGALAITAALEINNSKVYGCDIDKKCIQVARQNNKKHKTNIKFTLGDLFSPYKNIEYNNLYVLANLPYVPNKFTINEAAMNEPKLAIFGGEDGLDLYRILFKQLNESKTKKISMLTESLPFQHKNLENIANKYDFKLTDCNDFIQLFSNY